MNKQEIIELIKGTATATFILPGLGETTIPTIELKPMVESWEQQPTNGWIPVSSGKMPEFDTNCLVTADNGEVWTSKFYGYGEECQGYKEYPDGVWEINQCGLEVIAWQPLPEPYEETPGDEYDGKAEYEEAMIDMFDICDICENSQLDDCVYIENDDRKSCPKYRGEEPDD